MAKKSVCWTMPPDILEHLQNLAEADDRSVSSVALILIREAIATRAITAEKKAKALQR